MTSMPGETEPILEHVSMPIAMLVAGFFALACYNSIEIYVFLFATLKRRHKFYFWSMFLANTGIPIHAISSLLRYLRWAPSLPMSAVIVFGWWLMVPGQSVALYSRLHLVVGDPQMLRWILFLIAFVFIAMQVPTSITFLITSIGPAWAKRAGYVFDIFERVQPVAYLIQETIISGLYVYEYAHTLRPMEVTKGPRVRTMFRELVCFFVLVVALDISVVLIEYTGHFSAQITYKAVVYSIKLKVASVVLNNLIQLVGSGTCHCHTATQYQDSAQAARRLADSAHVPDTWWAQHRASTLGVVTMDVPGQKYTPEDSQLTMTHPLRKFTSL
ncbi:hypothetical protein F4780DRAFT_691047 [Xylariomycetidae sp. FL0641]|nr:hypothetical protein F4780DRAFT_691047 [Xylariomycetidae sp. FL0641]